MGLKNLCWYKKCWLGWKSSDAHRYVEYLYQCETVDIHFSSLNNIVVFELSCELNNSRRNWHDALLSIMSSPFIWRVEKKERRPYLICLELLFLLGRSSVVPSFVTTSSVFENALSGYVDALHAPVGHCWLDSTAVSRHLGGVQPAHGRTTLDEERPNVVESPSSNKLAPGLVE